MKSIVLAVILLPIIFILISMILRVGVFYSLFGYNNYENTTYIQILIPKSINLADDPALSVSQYN